MPVWLDALEVRFSGGEDLAPQLPLVGDNLSHVVTPATSLESVRTHGCEVAESLWRTSLIRSAEAGSIRRTSSPSVAESAAARACVQVAWHSVKRLS